MMSRPSAAPAKQGTRSLIHAHVVHAIYGPSRYFPSPQPASSYLSGCVCLLLLSLEVPRREEEAGRTCRPFSRSLLPPPLLLGMLLPCGILALSLKTRCTWCMRIYKIENEEKTTNSQSQTH